LPNLVFHGNRSVKDCSEVQTFYPIWNFIMKTRLNKIQIFLVISISLLITVFPAYLHYNYLVGVDLPSPVPIFEKLCEDYLLANQESKVGVSGSVFSVIKGISLLEQIVHVDFQTSSPYQKTFNLRC
jgi:hypothetical protein